jgi:hypothetical protein
MRALGDDYVKAGACRCREVRRGGADEGVPRVPAAPRGGQPGAHHRLPLAVEAVSRPAARVAGRRGRVPRRAHGPDRVREGACWLVSGSARPLIDGRADVAGAAGPDVRAHACDEGALEARRPAPEGGRRRECIDETFR